MYEITISYIAVNPNNGSDVTKKERLILEHAESFADAEQIGYDYGIGLTAIDVIAIKRSALKEIVNERQSENEKIFVATIVDHFITEDGEDKENKYIVVLFALDMNQAHQVVRDYMRQGLDDMELVGLKCTKFVDVLK